MKVDTVKAAATYGIALLVILLGFGFLWDLVHTDHSQVPVVIPVVASLMAGATGFVFGQESAKQGANAALSQPTDPVVPHG